MSRVMLIASDRPLPLCGGQTERTKTVIVGGRAHSIGLTCGFQAAEHTCCRQAVAELGYPMEPCRHELQLDCCETDLRLLLDYLGEHFALGEEAELWSVWVGGEPAGLRRCRGRLGEFDLDTLGMLFEEAQTCLTVVI